MLHKHTYKKLNDRQLWDSIRNGDKYCLSLLFSRYYPKLFSYGYKIVPREEFVKDCIQELFLTIWEQRKSVSKVQSVNSYLFISMRRMIFYNLRKNKNHQKRNSVYVEEFTEESPDIETRIIGHEYEQEFRRLLKEGLQDLSTRQKEIIELKYTDGLSNSEIANLLQIRRQSVYNHVSEAIKQLKGFVSCNKSAGPESLQPVKVTG